jgi:putative addiction module component (TIGR02574 family)
MLGSKDVERLEAEALALEPEDRAALVDALLESIDADEAVALSPTFRAELQRRCACAIP